MAGERNFTRFMGSHSNDDVVKVILQLGKFILIHLFSKMNMNIRSIKETFDFLIPYGLGEFLPGDDLGKFSTNKGILFKDMGLYTIKGKLPGTVHSGGTSTDNSYFFTNGFCDFRGCDISNGTA